MDRFIYSEMKIKDHDEMYKLWKDTENIALCMADSKENIERFLKRNKGISHVCRQGGVLVGTAICGHDGRRGYLYHMAVAAGYRHMGIGRSLAGRCLLKLKEAGIEKCHLFVFSSNIEGSDFWRSVGWELRHDIFVYSKNLNDN